MATLPTITITDNQVAKVLAAFKAHFGTITNAETIQAYKKWLATNVREVVLANEARGLDEAHNAAKRDALQGVADTLFDPDTIT